MIITKKAISRRTVLRGVGATLALPLLDSMVPALTALQRTAAKAPNRFGVVYLPNGIIMEEWTPVAAGSGWEFSTILKPLEPFRDHLTVISGLDNSACKCGAGGHTPKSAAFLTGAVPTRTTGTTRLNLGISMDQMLANTLGDQTALPSLELSLEGADSNVVVTCDTGYSCAYMNISWRNETTPMPRETNPRKVFERLFGDADSTSPAARLAQVRKENSILDSVLQEVGDLQRDLGPSDRLKLGEYLESEREIEKRIQTAEKRGARELPAFDSPAGIPVSWEEHAKLMFDLQVLAYQTDSTRIITFMLGRELSGVTYPQIGVSDSHHPITHHTGDKSKIEKVIKINTYHATVFASYLDKLRKTPDGDGSLLDHVTIVYGSPISDGNEHTPDNLPILLAGGGSGTLNAGRHIVCPKGTPLTSLQLSLFDKFGVPAERFGGNGDRLAELPM